MAVSHSALAAKVPEAASPAEAKPGKTALLTSAGGMRYFLRVPRGYDEEAGARMIVFLHGSNMNGLSYLETIESARWCRDDILVLPNGEKGDDPFWANNFTFQSAGPVAEVVEEVRGAFETTRVYLGGHSQGAYVTYSALMLHPELFDGAFPMAGDCWIQNEPNLWESKPEVLEKQRRIAIAVIHGQSDPVVPFSAGEHAHGIFRAMAYPKLRLMAPEKLGHQFGLSPVPEALEWLDAMTTLDPEDTMRLAAGWARDDEWGWVHQAALAVLANEKADGRSKDSAQKAIDAVEKKALEATTEMEAAMESNPPRDWLAQWFAFRHHFGATDAAKDLVESYDEARAAERDRGTALFRTAMGHRRGGDKEASDEVLEQILSQAPHSYHAYYALTWLGDEE